MRYNFVPSPDGPGGFGRLVDDETGDLINFGAYYRMALERDTLKAELTAERVRRIKAEEVVDFILRRPLVYSETSAWDICQEYRAQYPRVEQAPAKEYDPGPGCHAGRDGECGWSQCPQLRDGEPHKSGRHCPLDTGNDDDS